MNSYPLSLTGWRFIGWLGVASLCAISVLPPSSLLITGPEYGDKLYHLVAYATLTWWLALGYERRHWWSIAVGLALLGMVLELLQGLTPERIGSAWDEIANLTGILLGHRLAAMIPAGFPAFRQAE